MVNPDRVKNADMVNPSHNPKCSKTIDMLLSQHADILIQVKISNGMAFLGVPVTVSCQSSSVAWVQSVLLPPVPVSKEGPRWTPLTFSAVCMCRDHPFIPLPASHSSCFE